MTLHHLRLGIAATVAAAVTLVGCGSSPTPPAAGGSPPTVVASTNVYSSIAQAIGGDRVEVEALITDPAADPHSYESTPSDAAKVAGATVVVFNGGGYDDFLPALVTSSGRTPAAIDVVELSGLKPAGATAFNEHVWYSLPTVQKLAARLATDLSAADPANAAQYMTNAEAFTAQVEALTGRAAKIGTAHPGGRVAVTEPVPGYLIEATGLTNATPDEFAEAVEQDTDPSAAVLQQTLQLFAADPVQALILNSQTQTPTTDQVRRAAETAGVPVVEMSETLPPGVEDYVGWMGGQIDALGRALDRRAA